MNKKLLYIVSNNLEDQNMIGIKKKIFGQCQAFEFNDISTDLLYVSNDSIILTDISRGNLYVQKKWNKRNIYKSIYNILRSLDLNKYSVIYYRMPRFDFYEVIQLRYLSKVHKKKVLIEIPTYPYQGEMRYSWNDLLSHKKYYSYIYSLFGFMINNIGIELSKKYIDRFVTFSKDDAIFGVKTIRTSNGVDENVINKITLNKNKSISKNIITLLAVSSCAIWHGYDRLIEGLNLYFSSNNTTKVYLLIAGDGEQLGNYKELVNKYNLGEYVKFHGMVTGHKLEELYQKSDIGIESLARYRLNIDYNSTIKSKEYLLHGLPIVSGVNTELDYFQNIDFYYKVPSHDEPIDINAIVKYYKNLYGQKTNEEILRHKEIIRKFAVEHFSLNITVKPICEYIKRYNGLLE